MSSSHEIKFKLSDLRAGNCEAYKIFIEEAWKENGLRGIFSKYLLTKQEREDVFQQILEKLVKYFRSSTFVDQTHLMNWVCEVAENLIIDNWRKRSREVILNNFNNLENRAYDEYQYLDNFDDKEESLNPENIVLIKKSIMSLNSNKRTLLILRYYHDLTEKEIADKLGISEGTVKSSLSRIRKELKIFLEEKIKYRN